MDPSSPRISCHSTSPAIGQSLPTVASYDPATHVVLRSCEGDEFLVDLLLARRMRLVGRVLPPITSSRVNRGKITLSSISGHNLGKTIKWMQRHRDDWFDMANIKNGKVVWSDRVQHLLVEPWERHFFGGMTPAELLELATGARYLEVEPLKETACRFILVALEGKSLEEIEECLKMPVPESFSFCD